MWKRLTHPNILPLLGITITPFQLVSHCMSGGDLPGYLKGHPDADRPAFVGVTSIVFTPRLLSLSVIGHRKGPLLPPLLQCDSWRPQWSASFS